MNKRRQIHLEVSEWQRCSSFSSSSSIGSGASALKKDGGDGRGHGRGRKPNPFVSLFYVYMCVTDCPAHQSDRLTEWRSRSAAPTTNPAPVLAMMRPVTFTKQPGLCCVHRASELCDVTQSALLVEAENISNPGISFFFYSHAKRSIHSMKPEQYEGKKSKS